MKRGFTLIEVLAVIVILAFITSIVVPTVSKNLKESNEKVIMTSANNYIEAVETYLKAAALNKELDQYKINQSYSVASETVIDGVTYPALNKKVSATGDYPTVGFITIDDSYHVVSANLVIRKYRVTYDRTTRKYNITDVE